MDVRFSTVKQISRLALIGCVGLTSAAVFLPGMPSHLFASASSIAECYAVGCVVMLLLFVGFPRSRRSDLAELAILAGALMMIGQFALGHKVNILPLLGWSAGALTVLGSSHIERVRSMTRRGPAQPFSIAYEDDRRASRNRGFLAPPAKAAKFVQSA
jgi:hypothetical protein